MEPQNPQTPQSPQVPQQPAQPQVPPQATPAAPETPVTPTTQNPFSRGNSFSRRRGASAAGAVTPQAPIVSSGDDVVLPLAPAAKPKRNIWPWAIGAALVVLIVIATIAILSTSKKVSDKSNAAVREPFNRFSNYILFGEDSTNKPSLEGLSYDYYFMTVLERQSANEATEELSQRTNEYYSQAKIYYDSLAAAMVDVYGEEESEFHEHVIMLGDGVYLFYDTQNIIELSAGEIASQYFIGGYSGAVDYINNYYLALTESSSSISRNLALALIERDSITAQLYQIYDDGGCIQNNSVDSQCRATLDYSGYNTERLSQLNDIIARTKGSARNMIIENIGWLYDAIYQQTGDQP